MKRIYTLLTMLLMVCAGAWAEDVTSIINGYYRIHNNASTSKYVGPSYTCVEGLASAAMFRIQSVSYDNTTCYTIYSIDNNAYVNFVDVSEGNAKLTNGSLGANSYWDINFVSGTAATICPHGSSNSWNFFGGNSDGKFVGLYRSSDGNSKWLLYFTAIDFPTSLPAGKSLSIGSKATSITAATSATDNDHWYLISQTRGGETPLYNNGTQVYRAATSVTPTSLTGTPISEGMKYLVRFIDAGDGLYYVQFGDGAFIAYPNSDSPSNKTILTTSQWSRGTFAFTLIEGATTFSWNLSSSSGKRVDNNGAGGTVVYFNDGLQTDAGSNSAWGIYPVTFSNDIPYSFTTTDGAFFYCLSDNQAASATNYANLWLSKSSVGKPQVKLISNEALTTSTGGNNMRSTGGLFTTASSHQYNLSISEGRIISYTIVGTAEGALGITPAGGSKEDFAASASVNKKVTLDPSAKETYFTLSGSSVWLNVDKILIEYESDAVAVTSSSPITNDGIYMLAPHNAERGVLYAGTTYLDACGGHANTNYPANKTTAIDASDANQQFVFYTSAAGNTYIYSVGRGKFVGKEDGIYYKLANTPVNTWTLSNGAYTNYFHITSGANDKMATINAWVNTGGSGSKLYAVTGQSANEEANNFYITRIGTLTSDQQTTIASIVTDYEALMANLTELEKYTIGTGLGEYTNADFTTEAYKEENIASIRSAVADYDASILASVKSTATTSIGKMTLNMPASNGFYRIKGKTSGKYLAAGMASNGKFNMTEATDGTTVFYYDGTKLTNLGSGMCNGTNGTAWGWVVGNSASTVVFQNGLTYGGYAVKTSNAHFFDNGDRANSAADRGANLTINSSTDARYTNWQVIEMSSLPVTISAARYATLYAPVALEIPAGVKAFSGTVDKAKSQLTMHRIDGVIPANTAVVLKLEDGTEAGTFNFNITTTESGVGENSLLGTTAAQTYNNEFVLGIDTENSENIGFFKLTGSDVLPGFKAYLPSTVLDPGARSISVVWDDETTGIRSIDNGKQNVKNGAIYDLQGRKVANPSRGMYIINGRKVVVK